MTENSLTNDLPSTNEGFINAVKAGDAAKVKDLIANDRSLASKLDEPWFNYHDNPHWFINDAPAIVFAALKDNRELIDLLLDAGANINAESAWWKGAGGRFTIPTRS